MYSLALGCTLFCWWPDQVVGRFAFATTSCGWYVAMTVYETLFRRFTVRSWFSTERGKKSWLRMQSQVEASWIKWWRWWIKGRRNILRRRIRNTLHGRMVIELLRGRKVICCLEDPSLWSVCLSCWGPSKSDPYTDIHSSTCPVFHFIHLVLDGLRLIFYYSWRHCLHFVCCAVV